MSRDRAFPVRLVNAFAVASIVATLLPVLLAFTALLPTWLLGRIDGPSARRDWLFNAYVLFSILAPAVGGLTLVVTILARRALGPMAVGASTEFRRARWFAGVAIAGVLLSAFLFPFVFFATGGTR